MSELYQKGNIGKGVQIAMIIGNATLLFGYLCGWMESDNLALSMLSFAFCYILPLVFIVGLYGLRSGIICYTLVLVPTIFMSTADTFLLSFHLVLLYVVGFVVERGFLKSFVKTIISGIISGCVLNVVLFFVNNLVAERDFSNILGKADAFSLIDVAMQIVIAYIILHLLYRFLPEYISQLFQVGNFRFHVKNDAYQDYLKRRPKHPLGQTISSLIAGLAILLGVAAALVANSLIPDLGQVIERGPMSASGSAVSGQFAGAAMPPDAVSEGFWGGVDATSSATVVSGGSVTGQTGSGGDSVPDNDESKRPFADINYLNRTKIGAFTNRDRSGNVFIFNSESLAFDIKLILFLLDIIMPIVEIIIYLLEKRAIRPIADMAMYMGEFASDSIDGREAAASKINDMDIVANNELSQLHESIGYTVNEVIDYIQKIREEQQLKEDLRVAQKANEAKSNFLSNVSHEIRTPINAVLGMDEMILRETDDMRIRKYATDIKNSGRTLVSLINDILDFSRIEAGKLEILPVEYEMSSTLNDLVNMISVKAEEKGLEFKVDVDETIPHLLIGDEIRVKQCVINILNNAVKYTEKGSVSMSVGFEKCDETHIMLKVSVADTGIGMKEEDLQRLFKPFERIEENRNRNIEGAGLGMSIVKQLLDMMDSKLDVKSVYGEGSVFSFSLKQEVISWEPMGNFAEMYERSIESAKAYRVMFVAPEAKILVVDDTKMNLTVIRGLLEPTMVKIKTAMSGMEAIELVKKEHFDMIFLDQRMPGLDGIETLAAMKALSEEGMGEAGECNMSSGVPVIALTANAISGARERFIKAGFDDYLTKPIDSKKLESTIQNMLPRDKVIREGDEEYERYISSEAPAKVNEDQDYVSSDMDAPNDERLKRFADIEEISFKAGMENCMKEDILLEAVQDFYVASKTGADEIEGFFNDLDARNYTIKVHALKSSARLIGALELSDMAAHLEACGDEENWDEIHELTPKLLADYRLLSEKLSALFDVEPEDDDRDEIAVEALAEAYAGIREYVDAFDFDSADSIMEMLEGYRIPDEEKEKYKRIKDMVMRLDHDGLMVEL